MAETMIRVTEANWESQGGGDAHLVIRLSNGQTIVYGFGMVGLYDPEDWDDGEAPVSLTYPGGEGS
jgi:hypothetical protein